MEFTTRELKLIKRLRKQDRSWRWARWLMLTMGTFSFSVCAFCGYFLHFLISESRGHLDSDAVFLMMLFWTKCCMHFVFGVAFFVASFVKWHGDVNRILLLKLVDAQSLAVGNSATAPQSITGSHQPGVPGTSH